MKLPVFGSQSHHGRGFTLFEFAIVASIVGVLATVMLNRVNFYREEAERVAMQQVVGALRSALNLKIAALVVRDKRRELASLVEENPMNWLAQKPKNYRGEYFSTTATELTEGSWYFDRAGKKLVYLPGNRRGAEQGVRKQVNFKVRLIGDSLIIGNSLANSDIMNKIVLD